MTDWKYILTVIDTVLMLLVLAAGWGFSMAWLLRFIKD